MALSTLSYGLVLAPVSGLAQQKPLGVDDGFPFLTACITAKYPVKNTANKGIAIRVGNDAAVCFDTDLLRYSAGWTSPADWEAKLNEQKNDIRLSFPGWSERYLRLSGVTFDDGHGGHPQVSGNQKFATKPVPGWVVGSGDFTDPRSEPYGPIPESTGRYDGLYVVGKSVVLSYTVGGTKVYEQPGSVAKGGQTGFVRTFKTDKAKADIKALICEVEGGNGSVQKNIAQLVTTEGNVTAVGGVELPKGATLEVVGNQVVLKLAKGTPAATFKLVIWSGGKADVANFAGLLAGKPELAKFDKGSPTQTWPQEVVTKGELATSTTPDGAYTVDKLTPPVDNPWKRRVRFGGMDFFKDGKSAALSTWDGDVWVVTGIDDKLENLKWKRFASGGFETLGLTIVDDVVYTTGRDQITRYVDINKDGEADYYENFNNQVTSSPGFHEFQFDLQTDAAGNFYTAKAGPVKGGGRGFGGGGGNGEISAMAGTVQKISKDGKKREVYATGFRAPNGIGVRADGLITTGDNEGTWIPACPLNWVKQGGFYGVEDLAHKDPIPEFQKPLAWLSHKEFDNSGGGQVWVTSDKWGPFKGELLHMSYGKCALYLVLKDKVGEQMQGGVVKIPVNFTSSAMRARFNKLDGQLYVAGLRGWQTSAANLTGFDRVRYTGKPVYTVSAMKVDKAGIHLTFTQPLDPKDATDVQNYSGQQWNYRRSGEYGSPEVTVSDPKKNGRDRVDITSAKLSADGKTVTLEVAGLQPVMQFLLKYNITAKDGTGIKQDILQTIHEIPGASIN